MSPHSEKHFARQAKHKAFRQKMHGAPYLGIPRNSEPVKAFGKYAGRLSWHIAHDAKWSHAPVDKTKR